MVVQIYLFWFGTMLMFSITDDSLIILKRINKKVSFVNSYFDIIQTIEEPSNP